MPTEQLKLGHVNRHLARKQHLWPAGRVQDLLQVVRDIVALHATNPAGPYLSLWARVPGFQRSALDEMLYDRHELVRALCMRTTLHLVPGDEVSFFFRAFAERRTPAELERQAALLVQSGLCQQEGARALLGELHRRVLDVVVARGPSTVRDIARMVPELTAKVQHSAGKSYAGEFSVGSRLVPGMCALGLLVRARPRGTWRSTLHQYAALSDWLPEVDLAAVASEKARAWLVRHYLAAFGPATLADVQWWTGFTKGETEQALHAIGPALVEVAVEGLGGEYWMLGEDVQQLRQLPPLDAPSAFFLPGLDPYVMGYQDRRRFLAPEHRVKVFDRAGNAMPTIWVNGRVVGAWGQREDGSVVCGLFEPVDEMGRALIEGERQRLEAFLGGEYLRPRTHTPFIKSVTQE